MANCKASFEKHKVSSQNQNVAFQEAAGLLPEYWVCTYIHKSLKGSRSFAYESSRALFKSSRGSLRVFWSFVFSGLWHSSGSGFTNECHFLNTHIPQWTSIVPNGTGLEVTLSDVTTVESVCYQVLPISFTPDLCITLWATSL